MRELLERFDKLSGEQLDALRDYPQRPGVLVIGMDRSPGPGYRGGCLPWLLLGGAAAMWFWGLALGLPDAVRLGLAMALATWGGWSVLRTIRATLRSKKLLARDEGWHGVAWTTETFCLRTLELCAIAEWSEVEDIRLLDDSWGDALAGTLWLHLGDGEKLLLEPRREDGTFAGRPLKAWFDDLVQVWGKATNRKPSNKQGPRPVESETE